MKYGLYFTKGFITTIDELLADSYSDGLKREDFLHFFYILEKTRETNNTVALPRDIREIFGRHNKQWKFPQIVRTLEDKSIIFSTTYSNYAGNNFCKSYGYTVDFTSKVIDKELEFQLCEISEKTYNIINRNYELPDDPILLKHYNTIKHLKIDLNKAETFAKQFSGEKFLRTVRDISTIYNKDRIIVIRDERSGRLFTSFNMMKKELREYCTFKGEKLHSLDLKSSQPYLLASILLQENPDNSQVQAFYKLVAEQDLYDWLLEKWGGFEYFSKEESRTLAKKIFFSYLYKKNQGTNTAQIIIQDAFPDVYDLIKNKKRKEELWLTLQKLEASIFVEVSNEFVEEGCLSVHDSIYFPESIRGRVEARLNEMFSRLNLINYKIR